MLTNKQVRWLGIFGSIASIVGLCIYFVPAPVDAIKPDPISILQHSSELNTDIQQKAQGDCSPNMAGVQVSGNLTLCNSSDSIR